MLEEIGSAVARGAAILAEVVGYGMSADAHHLTAPPEDGDGVARVMVAALEDADLGAGDIQYLNAHATSTPLGDKAEARAIDRIFGRHTSRLAVSSTKSMTGHLLGGAGALEAVATVMALHDRVSPPTINLDDKDPEVDLDIPTSKRDLPDGDVVALNNSFGFGGANVAVAFGSV